MEAEKGASTGSKVTEASRTWTKDEMPHEVGVKGRNDQKSAGAAEGHQPSLVF